MSREDYDEMKRLLTQAEERYSKLEDSYGYISTRRGLFKESDIIFKRGEETEALKKEVKYYNDENYRIEQKYKNLKWWKIIFKKKL